MIRSSLLLRLLCAGALSGALGYSHPARACSPGYCAPPSGLPFVATIPQNLAGVFLYPGYSYPGMPSQVSLTEFPVGASVGTPLPVTVVEQGVSVPAAFEAVRPSTLPAVGSRITLSAPDQCDPQGATVEVRSWTVGEPVPLPEALGVLHVGNLTRGAVPFPAGSTCSELSETAYVDIELELDASAIPFSDAFVYETRVDGELYAHRFSSSSPYPSDGISAGGSWRGRGVDRIVVQCGDVNDGVPPGHHTLEFRAYLPDGTVLATPVQALELGCANDDGGCAVRAAGTPARGRSVLALLALLGAMSLVIRRSRAA